MEPLGLTAYRLAKDIKVPVSRIQEILHDKRRITADTVYDFVNILVCLMVFLESSNGS